MEASQLTVKLFFVDQLIRKWGATADTALVLALVMTLADNNGCILLKKHNYSGDLKRRSVMKRGVIFVIIKCFPNNDTDKPTINIYRYLKKKYRLLFTSTFRKIERNLIFLTLISMTLMLTVNFLTIHTHTKL